MRINTALYTAKCNIRFLNDAARRHYLEKSVHGSKVVQLNSELSPGFFYTHEAYETMCNLMTLKDYETHTVTEWDAGLAALYTDKVYTKEDVIAEFEGFRKL